MTSGSPTNSADQWPQLFRQSQSSQQSFSQSMFGPISDSVVVTTTSPNSTSATNTSGQVGTGNEASRVARSNRRRTRASRKAPTTLLNTDTTNFRAMVQQFTGIPSGPYSSTTYRAHGGSTVPVNYSSANYSDQLRQSFSHVGHDQREQYQQGLQHYQQQQPYQQTSEAMFSLTSSSPNDLVFLQRFNNSSASSGNNSNMELSADYHGFMFDGMSTSQVMMPKPTSSSTNTRNNSDSYFS